jgi:hypothetical protein
MRRQVLLAALLMPFLSAHAEAPAAPEVSAGFVLHPTFLTEKSSFVAGNAFVVTEGEHTVVLTAYHLFGPAGGLPSQVLPADVPKKVRQVILKDAWTDKIVGRTGRAFLLADAAPLSVDASLDLVVFPLAAVDPMDIKARMEASELHPGTLATKAPAVGDAVFVSAEAAPPYAEARTFRATLVEVSATGLYYLFDVSDLSLAGLNGAPVLTAAGEIVGMHLGGGPMDDGGLIGVANPASQLRARITQALKASK